MEVLIQMTLILTLEKDLDQGELSVIVCRFSFNIGNLTCKDDSKVLAVITSSCLWVETFPEVKFRIRF